MKRAAVALLLLAILVVVAIWRELRRNFAWEEPFEPDTDPYPTSLLGAWWRRNSA